MAGEHPETRAADRNPGFNPPAYGRSGGRFLPVHRVQKVAPKTVMILFGPNSALETVPEPLVSTQ
jgi:hypothetical protein